MQYLNFGADLRCEDGRDVRASGLGGRFDRDAGADGGLEVAIGGGVGDGVLAGLAYCGRPVEDAGAVVLVGELSTAGQRCRREFGDGAVGIGSLDDEGDLLAFLDGFVGNGLPYRWFRTVV